MVIPPQKINRENLRQLRVFCNWCIRLRGIALKKELRPMCAIPFSVGISICLIPVRNRSSIVRPD